MSDLENALDFIQERLSSGVDSPRTTYELIEEMENSLLEVFSPSASRLFVPDAEGLVTPDVREDQIRKPLIPLESEIRDLSGRSKTLVSSLLSFVNESEESRKGLQAKLEEVSAKVTAAQNLVSSSNSGWLRFSENFDTISRLNSQGTKDVFVDTSRGGGMTLAPAEEKDLSDQVASLTVASKRSTGLPGNNLELAALQDTPSTQTPAAGASQALASARHTVGSSGGSGQEPTVSYAGYPDLHADYSVILKDSDKYIEIENIFVKPVQPCTQHGTAFVYDAHSGSTVDVRTVTQNLGWSATIQNPDGSTSTNTPIVKWRQYPPGSNPGVMTADSDILRQSLELDFGQPIPLNQLEVDVQRVQALWPKIESVTTSQDYQRWYALRCQNGSKTWTGNGSASGLATGTGDSVRGTSLWEIPSSGEFGSDSGIPEIRYLNIVFSQDQGYLCPKGIGHPYYVTVSKETKNSQGILGGIFGGNSHSESKTITRYAGPEPLINLSPGVTKDSKNNVGSQIGATLGQIGGTLIAANNPGFSGITGIVATVGAAVGDFIFGHSSDKVELLQEGEYDDVFQAFRQCISISRIKPLRRSFPVGKAGQALWTIPFDHPVSAVRLFSSTLIPDGASVLYEILDGENWKSMTAFPLGSPGTGKLSSQQTLVLDKSQIQLQFRITIKTQKEETTPRVFGFLLEGLPEVS